MTNSSLQRVLVGAALLITAAAVAGVLLGRPSATDRHAARALPIDFFVRPELEAVRFRNDGGVHWPLCRAEIDGRYTAELGAVAPGQLRLVPYRAFRGLDPAEAIARAQRRLELVCFDREGVMSTRVYGLPPQ